ncbi:hypothetical protein AYL20_01255 [Acinetobacter venetianus]|uniref:hypothetical protein n=1 Tax=Acinetobacter venetianus TaxID=52133 RepID=UPI0007758C1A|nr:hypothetical protein [Acinetobacter venetianus]KXO82651.1 hypothetical protein AYL20_01255 [Acinetobacter venetianus]
MVSPIDYSIDVLSPFQTAMQGWAAGTQDKLARAEEARRQQLFDQQQAAAQQAAIRQQAMNEDLYKFSLMPNKTTADYTNMITRYPTLTEPYQKAWGMQNSDQQQQTLSTASQVYAALGNGSPDVAKTILDEQIKGYENSGMKKEAFNLKNISNLIDKNPQAAQANLGMLMSTVAPDQFKNINDSLNSSTALLSQIAKTEAETGKIQAETQGQTIENRYKPQQIQTGINQTESQTALNYANVQNMADRLNLDRDRLLSDYEYKFAQLNPSNVKLSDGAQKLVNDTMLASVASEQSANRMNNLADQFEQESQAGGLWTKGWVGFKRITGWSNDDQSAMIREYDRLRNSEAIKSLPPGPATDKDIELALRGMPPSNADSTTITSFLRGMAKMGQRDAAYQQMQSEWVNQVGNLGSTKRDVEVLGVKVPSGTTFSGYATKNLNKAIKRQASQAVDRDIATGQRSYFSAVQ